MSGTVKNLDCPALSAQQWELVEALARSLTPSQAIWVSGYFAGLSLDQPGRASAPTITERPRSETSRGDGQFTRTITVLYGTETGNSASLAQGLEKQAHARGLTPVVVDMAEYNPRRLKDEQSLLIVTSTHGDGDPPQGALDFFEFVEGGKAPRLPNLRYAVLALGDSTYERYCEAGKRLDRRLEELGAKRFYPTIDCDVDYADPAEKWTAQVVDLLAGETTETDERAPIKIFAPPAVRTAGVAFDKRNPFSAGVVENISITGRGSSKEIRHIELSLAHSGFAFEPGDALGVVPRNDPRLVAGIVGSLELQAAADLVLEGSTTTLGNALESYFEITTATPRFLEHWAKLTGAHELNKLLLEEQAQERRRFLQFHHVIDIIKRFPVVKLAPKDFVAGLRPLQPRLYSIASSPLAFPDEAHLTVAVVRYELQGEPRAGVASGYLADRVAAGGTLPVFIQANPYFRLPADDAPIIMIGAGTGIAPYRAFVQTRQARGAVGRSWLFFGERQFHSDFLYQTEWQAFLKKGSLTRMDVAFSRDGPQKVYVQHKMRKYGRELFAWLEEGAHLYVCGDAAHLAPDVHTALIDIIAEEKAVDREAADFYLRELQRQSRYQRDVY